MDAFICGGCHRHFVDIDTFLTHKRLIPDCRLDPKLIPVEQIVQEEPQIEVVVDSPRQLPVHQLDHQLESEAITRNCSGMGENNVQTQLTLISSTIENGGTVLGDFQIMYNGTQLEGSSELIEGEVVDVGYVPLEPRETADDIQPYVDVKLDSSIFACRLCNHYALQEGEVLRHLFLKHGKIVAAGSDDSKSSILSLRPLQSPEIERQLTLTEETTSQSDVVRMLVIRDSPVRDLEESPTTLPIDGSVVNETRRRGRPRKNNIQGKKQESDDVTQKQKNDVVVQLLGHDGLYRCKRCNRSFRKERHIRGHRCFPFDSKEDGFLRDGVRDDIVDAVKPVDKVTEDSTGDLGNVGLSKSNAITDGDGGDGAVVLHRLKPIPVFSNEEERVAFKERLNAVDLTCVDHLFTKHFVEQQITNGDHNSTKPSRLQKCKQLPIFSCDVCSKVFTSTYHIRLHCLVHTDLKPFRCLECSYASNTKGNLYTHVRKHTGNCYRCSQCEFRSSNRSHVTEHEAVHSVPQLHTCRVCSRKYRTFKSLGNHVRRYHSDSVEDGDYLASFSTQKFTGDVLHQCHVCLRKFKKKIDRERHLYLHDVCGSPHVLCCQLCPYKTGRHIYLEKHFRRHRLVYCCCRCAAKFLSVLALRQHLKEEHTSVDEDYDVMTRACIESSWFLPDPDENSFLLTELVDGSAECVYGDSLSERRVVEFDDVANAPGSTAESKASTLIRRLKYKRMTSKAYEVICQTFGNEECEFCGRRFHSAADLLVHRRCHVREIQFKCSKCSYSAATKDNLKRHVEIVHEQRNFMCSTCNYVARSHTSLWQHQQKHTAVTPKCNQCEKTFTSMKKLRQHVNVAHPDVDGQLTTTIKGNNWHIRGQLGKQSFQCPYCDRIFHRSSSDLKKHIWIHEGLKPFKCSVCAYACRSRNNLNVHMLRHSDDRPHSCLECGRLYKSKAALRFHQKAHGDGHPIGQSHCDYSATQRSNLKRNLETHDTLKKYTHGLNNFALDASTCKKVCSADNQKEGQVAGSSPSVARSCSTNSEANVTSTEEIKMYKCRNCYSVFGNLSNLKRHLKVKHCLPVQNLKALKLTELQLVGSENEREEEREKEPGVVVQNVVANELQCMMTNCGEDTESVALATVNLIQQIIDKGGLETGHLTLHTVSEGLQVAMNPETFIIRDVGRVEAAVESCEGKNDDGMAVKEGGGCQSSQYTIQFVTEPMEAGLLSLAGVT